MEINQNYNLNMQKPSQPKAGLVQNNLEGDGTSSLNQSINQNNTQNQNIIKPELQYNYQMAKMDNETMLKYLQSLLKLPNTINEFIAKASNTKINPQLKSILVENMINVKLLNEFLNQNSTTALSKLIQIISESNKDGFDTGQLKDILNILTSIQATTNINTNSIKEFILLYIPLNMQIYNNETVSTENEELEEKIKKSKNSILFETITFSNILCCFEEINYKIFINLYFNKNFPKDKFNSILTNFSKELNINISTDYILFENSKTNNPKQNFKINSMGYISPNMLILSHLIISAIFKIDNDFSSI